MTSCTSCPAVRTFIRGLCLCDKGYYEVTGVCTICDPSCSACEGSATSCITTIGDCPNGFYEVSGVCEEVCGDGRTLFLDCDDGNVESGDGCSADCKMEADFVCTGATWAAPSVCSYAMPINFNLVDITKNLEQNTIEVVFQIEPALASLDSIDFLQAITTNIDGNCNFTYQYDGNGNLVVFIDYNTTLQDQNITINFDPASVVTNGTFNSTPSSTYTFLVEPTNNVPASYYE